MPRHQMGYESDAMAAITFAVAARASPTTRPAVFEYHQHGGQCLTIEQEFVRAARRLTHVA